VQLPFKQMHRALAVITTAVGVLFVPRPSFAQG
jgi:hypothetical protein